MTDSTMTEATSDGVPALPPDDENEALIDAGTTFKITAVSAVLFVLSAVFIIMRTRMG